MNIIRWLAAPLMALGCATTAMASDAGRVTGVSGPVSVVRGSVTHSVKAGSVLQAGDVLVTGDTGSVQWSTPDEGVMALAPNSRLTIQNYEWTGSGGSSHYDLKGGGISVISGDIQSPGYRMSTPAADITVNGTQYKSIVCKGNCAGFADGMYVIVAEGNVTVSNQAGSLSGSAGQVIYVAGPDSAPVLGGKAPTIAVNFDFDFEVDTEAFGDVIERPLSPS